MEDEELNAAIDEVARQMTESAAVEHADFRRRVLARINAGESPRGSWRAAFVLSPIAVAAAIAVAILLARSESARPGRETPAIVQRVPAPPPPAAGTGERVPTPTVPQQTNTVAVTPSRELREPSEVLALAPPRLTIEPIDVPTIQMDSIALPQLEPVAPIDVTPLSITSEGDRP